MSDLLFFPMSMPDETLHSRITRYHFLSGNRTEAETFRDLFGSDPFGVGMLPKKIEVLAGRLPGDEERNLEELICGNTTFPAYRPFLGVKADAATSPTRASVYSGAARIPRREGTIHGKARICLSCVQQDLIELGYAYWHRSHHLPGVTVCWRHGNTLIHDCPNCSHPFYRKLKLLPNLTESCICGWNALSPASEPKGSDLEIKFAAFAHDILIRDLPLISGEALSLCYVRQCRKRGFTCGELVSKAKLFESIRMKFGDEHLSKMDGAFGKCQHNQWLRFSHRGGQMDLPLARHLILALHLFGSADKFHEALNCELILRSSSKISSPNKTEKQTSKKTQHRKKVETLLALRSDAGIEYLWKNAYQATRWLKENDSTWLMTKLSSEKSEPVIVEKTNDPRDESFSAIISSGAEELYRIQNVIKRVNKGNLLKLLPIRIGSAAAARRRNFPLVAQQVDLQQESIWHFHLRRLIWAFAELTRLGLPLNYSNVKLVSRVPGQVLPVLISFFEWDLEEFVKKGVDPDKILKSTGVTRKWEGPPGYDVPLGGYAYRPVKSATQS